MNQKGTYTIHAVTMMKYHDYHSILILKHANILDEVMKSNDVNLYKITPYKKCIALKYMYAQ